MSITERTKYMKTIHTTTQTIFVNLFAAITAEKMQRLQTFINDVNEINEVSKLDTWYYNDLLPASKKRKSDWNIDELKAYLIDRKTKETHKAIDKELTRLQIIESAPDLISITVSIEWKKSRMWGNNPNAEAKVNEGNIYEYYNSGSISGCGYDKESTAIANAVNQSNAFLKAMYLVKEQNITTGNRELFGYGSGSGILPRLEGGVGVSCYPKIFDTIGFKWSNTASGKTFDVYTATKIN